MKSFNIKLILALSVLAVVSLVSQVSAQSASPAVRYFQMGGKYVQAEDYEMAAKAFRASVRSDPKFAEAWMMLGATLFDLDYWEEAEQCIAKAIELKPQIGELPAVKQMLSLTGVRQPPAQEGLVVSAGTEKSSPPNANRYYELGMRYGKSGDVKNAVEAFYAAVKLDPNHAEAWVGLGAGLYDLGDEKSALYCLRRGIALNPALGDNEVVKAMLTALSQKPVEQQFS